MADELLPPDPTVDGWYWVGHNSMRASPMYFNATKKSWWNEEDIQPSWLSARMAAEECYTLASPHPIPTAAQLDALHRLVETLEDKANDSVISPSDVHFVGPVTYTASGRRVEALREAADMLREALKP